MKNFRYNRLGTVDCDINNEAYGAIPTTLSAEESQEIIDSGVEIAQYIVIPKATEQLNAEIELELSKLDPTLRMLEGAISGDKYAIKKIAENNIKKEKLRAKLIAL